LLSFLVWETLILARAWSGPHNQSPISYQYDFQAMTIRAFKRALVKAGFLVRFDPCKPHRRVAFGTLPAADLRNRK